MWWEEIGLPPSYWLEYDADLILLRRPPGGGMVGAFSVRGADPVEIAATAWEDAEWASQDWLRSPTGITHSSGSFTT